MQVIKKYLLIEIWSSRVDHKLIPKLSYGDLEYGDSPDYLFDTEEEAIEAAYKRSQYDHYIIVPQITFNTYD